MNVAGQADRALRRAAFVCCSPVGHAWTVTPARLYVARVRGTQHVTNVVRSASTRTQAIVLAQRIVGEVRRALWFKPALAVLVGLIAGTAMARVLGSGPGWLSPIAFRGNANDARQVLTVVIGALIPVTSLVFALTVVTLQIASTQFSPRLLRTFLRDFGTQVVLGCFVGTIAFCLAVIYEINTDVSAGQVPRLAITMALTLAVGCIAMLVYYFGHITNAVRIDSIMRQVERDTRRLLHHHHPPVAGTTHASADVEPLLDPDATITLEQPGQAYGVVAGADGYLQGVDPRLLALAVRKGLTIQVVPTVGYYVVRGQQLAVVWADDGSPLKPTTADAILHLIEVAPERRIERDLGLGLRQLVDIINRAMSTGQNDPYTGTQAVHHLSSLMLDCSRRDFDTHLCRSVRQSADRVADHVLPDASARGVRAYPTGWTRASPARGAGALAHARPDRRRGGLAAAAGRPRAGSRDPPRCSGGDDPHPR